jgi:hypothetical protein
MLPIDYVARNCHSFAKLALQSTCRRFENILVHAQTEVCFAHAQVTTKPKGLGFFFKN